MWYHKFVFFLACQVNLVMFSKSNSISSGPIAPLKIESPFPSYISTSIRTLHGDLFRQAFHTILENATFFNENKARAEAPFNFKNPLDAKHILNYSITQEPADHTTLLDYVNKIIQYSPKNSHPYNVHRHAGGLDPYGIVGDFIGTSMSAIVDFFADAPIFTSAEYAVQQRIRKLIGYPTGKGDGLTTPGNGMGNAYVIQVALQFKFPQLKNKGFVEIGSPQSVLFLSEHASYYFEKFCIWEGIGLNGCIRVGVDDRGRMNISDLETKLISALAKNQVPFMVVATAGTPILGAIDPIDHIAEIAGRYKLWLHVDGLVAGSAFLSDTQKHRLKGIEKSDSFSWSVNKGLATPHVSSELVSRHENIFKNTFSYTSPYVFSPAPQYNITDWDYGDHTMQCTRRPDNFKLWFLWKAKGQKRLAEHVDYTYQLVKIAVTEIGLRNDSFKLILQNFEGNLVAFYYIPRSLRGIETSLRESELKNSRFSEKLKARLLNEAILSISVQTLPRYPVPFFVMNLGNSVLLQRDIVYILDQIALQGELLMNLLNGMQNETASPESFVQLPPAPECFPDFVSAPIRQLHHQFIERFMNFVLEEATFIYEKKQRIQPAIYKTPEQLAALFDFSLLKSTGTMTENSNGLLNIIQNVFKYRTHTTNPNYSIHVATGLDPYTIIGDYVAAILNSQMTTYEDNPMLTLMEEEVIQTVRKLVGYTLKGSGFILPGGSACIQVAILIAFMHKESRTKMYGNVVAKKEMVAYVSIAAHGANYKGSFFKGIGLENCVPIDLDEQGKMSVPALRKAILKTLAEGKIPFMVVATAGTTVLGSFDNITEISSVCKAYNLWLHIDGAYGGSLIFSTNQTLKNRMLEGLERADSFNFNPHKMLGAVRESSVIVFREEHAVVEAAPPSSDQEFGNIELYKGTENDPGVLGWFPDRRGNGFKIWLLLKAKGLRGLGEHMNAIYKLKDQVVQELLRRHDSFELARPDFPFECPHVHFYYIPKRLRQLNRKSQEFQSQLIDIQFGKLRSSIPDNRISISNEAVKPAYFIIYLTNSAITFDDVKYLLDLIESSLSNL